MGFLGKSALKGIAAYKYKAGTYTYLDNVLNPFWGAMVEFLPMWMAPNLVTMIGTVIMGVTTAIQLWYAPHLYEPTPSWVYAMCGTGLFLYQTFDAMDGKQARRTGTSSPLGQLFDHGCDALSTVFNVISAGSTLQLGGKPELYFVLSAVCITFYMAQWEEYHTGVMSCGNGWFGVTEGQLTLIGVHFVTAIFGPAMWSIPIVSSITGAHVIVIALFTSNIILVTGQIKNTIRTPLDAMPAAEVGEKHRGKTLAMLQLIPVFLHMTMGWLWVTGPNEKDYKSYPLIFLFAHGIGYVLNSTRMIVSHMAKVPFALDYRVVIPFALVLLNVYGPHLGLFSVPYIRPLMASIVYALYIIGVYVHYISHVVYDICCYLNIYLFKIKTKQ